MAPSRLRPLSPARASALRPLLELLERGTDKAARLGFDPVELPRRQALPEDREVVGLFAAALAYGRADVFKPRLERVVEQMGSSPSRFCERMARSPSQGAFAGFQYRFNQPEDVAALAAGIGHVRLLHGGIGARLAMLLRRERGEGEATAPPDALRRALAGLADELRGAPPARAALGRRGTEGLRHLLPDPRGPGPCKRWNLYLRWMVRGPDPVDLGVWPEIPRAALVIPLDTHVARIARYLGLTRRRDMSWRTAREITESLRGVDPEDPVRFDFALCHLGMSGACPARLDLARCASCVVRRACLRGGGAGFGTASSPARRASPRVTQEVPIRSSARSGAARGRSRLP